MTRPRSHFGDWQVRFLNETGSVASAAHWNDHTKPKLWLYNLHYFDDLSGPIDAKHRQSQRDLIRRWIAENPIGHGNGWEPYPISLRIVNWIKWASAGGPFDSDMQQSLIRQVRYLALHIEWHLLGNHLFANAKALVFAGLYFEGAEANRWLARGRDILAKQLPEQILPDGGHFELSPMYHSIILEDVLDLISLSRRYGVSDGALWRDLPGIAQDMRRWLAAMTYPDGGLSFFNDAAFAIAATKAELDAYARRLTLPDIAEPGEGLHHLPDSGYIRVNRGPLAAILDVAAVGTDYIPGHAHADTLSFELSLGEQRVFVNAGTSTYAPGSLRKEQRATRSHNTVELNGENSSDVWASFRVGRRARVLQLEIDAKSDGSIDVMASHDGYRRLAGSPIHRRTWSFGARTLSVTEDLQAAAAHAARAFLHVHPNIRIERKSGQAITLRGQAGCEAVLSAGSAIETLSQPWYPEFGKSLAATTLAMSLPGGRQTTTLAWT